MSHDYPNMEAYSAAENRLLDIISPQKDEDDLDENNEDTKVDDDDDDEPFDEADAAFNELGQHVTTSATVSTSHSRRSRRLSTRQGPMDPAAVNNEVNDVSSDTSDMENAGSDYGDFMGFSDVDADEDTLNCSAPGIYGLRRRRKASTAVDNAVTTTADVHSVSFDAQHTMEDTTATATTIQTTTMPTPTSITYTDANFEMLPTMTAPEQDIMQQHGHSVVIGSPPQQQQQEPQPRRASIVYSFDHNNVFNIYADDSNCIEVETGENSGMPREIILNDTYAIQTIVDNEGQQCIIYGGNMTDLVETDDENGMCFVEVPFNDVDANQLGLNVNNMNLQYATAADSNVCIVHQESIGGIHERNQMAAHVAMEHSELHQQHMAQECLIATDEPLNESVGNLYYGIPPNASPTNNVIILSTMAAEQVEAGVNEVYIGDIINADEDEAHIVDTFNAEQHTEEQQQHQQMENANMHGYDDNMDIENVNTMLAAATTENQNDALNITLSDDTNTAAATAMTANQAILDNEATHTALPKVDANLSNLGDNEFTSLFDGSEHVGAPEADHFLNVPTENNVECAPLLPEPIKTNQTQPTKADNLRVETQISHIDTSAVRDDEVIVLTDNVPTAATFTRKAPPPIYKRCATSTTTEFPNSSNSNQNFSGDDLPSPSFAPRTPLLKNTLSLEALDRKLLSICQLNPQLSIEEKIDKWSCNGDYSDVEDVTKFDEQFEKRETEKSYFAQFQKNMLENIKHFQMQQTQQELLPQQSHEHSEDATESSSTLQVKAQRLPTIAIVAAEATEETTADTTSSSSADNRQELHFSTTYQHNLHIVGGGTGSSDTEETNLLEPKKLRVASASELTLVPTHFRTTETQTSKSQETLKESIATSTTDLNAAANVANAVKSLTKVCTNEEESTQSAQILTTPPDTAIDLDTERLPVAPLKENEIPKDVSPADISAKIVATSNNQQEPNNCLSDASFYEQHEFCNYLGLTGLATANAVAIAMQELANSTIARRSLRVRTQQQLDRMRNDSLRGRKRTEKIAAATSIRVPGGVDINEPPADTSNNSTKAESSQVSTTTSKAIFREHQIPISVDKVSSSDRLTDFDENDGTLKFICKIPALNEKENEQSAKLYDYFFKDVGAAEQDLETQQQLKSNAQDLDANSLVTKSGIENCDLEVQQRLDTLTPTHPTPTVDKLHERMQQCLKQARETKPAIYIVQSMNNDNVYRPSAAELLVPHPSLEALTDKSPFPSYINDSSAVGNGSNATITASTNTVTSPMSFATAVSAVSRIEKKLKYPIKEKQLQKTLQRLSQRAKSMPQNDKNIARSLVTRSTTTLNSKQLRNRKVSLMKSYYLTNETRYKRLSGGSATNSTALLNKKQKAITAQSGGGNVRQRSDVARNVTVQPKVEVMSAVRSESPKRKKLVAANNLNKQNNRTNLTTSPLRSGESEAKKKKLLSSKNTITSPPITYPTSNKATAHLPRRPITEQKVKTPTKSPVVTSSALQQQKQQQQHTNKIIRSRASSTPVPGAKANFEPRQTPALLSLQEQQKQNQSLVNQHQYDEANDKTLRVIKAPVPIKTDYMLEMNTHEFITNRAVVCPPAPTAAIRRLMWTTARNVSYEKVPPPPSTQQTEMPIPVLSYPTIHGISCGGNRQRETAGKQYCTPLHTAIDNIELNSVRHLTSAWPGQRNPLVNKHGKVLYIYYEQEMLIVVQEKLLSFWKYSKIFTVLRKKLAVAATSPKKTAAQAVTELKDDNESIISADNDDDDNSDIVDSIGSSIRSNLNISETERKGQHRKHDWVHLGRLRRVTNDIEVNTPYTNRICINNSIPVYLEMRCRQLDHNRREGKLLSTYVNVYYYSEDDLRPKMHSVHLDAVPGESAGLIYTTIIDSRYFVLAWPQEMMLGKTRTGLCKYSLMPSLDTLASIRGFKNIKHAIKYIECLGVDKLIGYGPSRVTIWDHRSGDTLMNYDLCMDLGYNLGAFYYPGLDVGQCGIIVLYQQIGTNTGNSTIVSELQIIACDISCSTPSHRVLQTHKLPSPQFDANMQSTNTGDHLIIKSSNNEEIWISNDDPQLLTFVAAPKNGAQRYYSRNRSHVVEVGKRTLTVNSIANHMLKLASENTLMSTPCKSTNRK